MKAAIYSGIQEIEIQEIEMLPPPAGYLVVDPKQTGRWGWVTSGIYIRVLKTFDTNYFGPQITHEYRCIRACAHNGQIYDAYAV